MRKYPWVLCCLSFLPMMAFGNILEPFHNKKSNREWREIYNIYKKEVLHLPEVDIEKPTQDMATSKTLSITDALKMALKRNVELQNQRDALKTSALELFGVAHRFDPQWQGSLAYQLDWSENVKKSSRASQSVSVNQRIRTGADIGLSLSSQQFQNSGTDHSTTAALSFEQELLKGFGYSISHESLIQGRRSYVYELRQYKREIDAFAIDFIRQYLDIVNQKSKVETLYKKVESDRWLMRRTKAFFDLGKKSKIELFRITQQVNQSKNQWINQVQRYENALERFKLLLSIPAKTKLDLQAYAPIFKKNTLQSEKIVEQALLNRLDYKSDLQSLEDSRRRFKHAKNGLLPELKWSARARLSESNASSFADQKLDEKDLSTNLVLKLPLDKTSERLNYFQSKMRLQRIERDTAQKKDEISIEVKNNLRNLERLEKTIELQNLIIDSEEKRVKMAKFRFQIGKVDNREVIEASESLTQAMNNRLDSYANHFVSTLRLYESMGTLHLDQILNILAQP